MDNNEELESVQRDYVEEVCQLFRNNLAPKIIKEKLSDYHENDISDALALLSKEERTRLYQLVDDDELADIFEHAEEPEIYLNELGLKRRADILSKIEVADAVDYLKELPKEEKRAILTLLPEEERSEIILTSSYDEDEIGSHLSTNYIEINSMLSIKEAMKELVSQAQENDNISTIYVSDKDGIYAGAIDLKDLITASASTTLDSITMTSFPYVYSDEEISDCLERLKDYSEDTIPVLDRSNHIVGVLTAGDLTEIVDEEMGEDYAKLAGLSAKEDLHESLIDSLKKRLPWLIILLVLGMVVSSVVGVFETVVATLPLIASFQSLILDMAGNIGTQSLAVTIRVLMDEDTDLKEKLSLVFKESRVAVCNGLILGVLSFAAIGLFLVFGKGVKPHIAFSISLCVAISLLIAMFLSGLCGTVVPMVFKKFGVDPAVASGPLITTINDLVAVVVYYGSAYILLIQILKI